MSKATKFTERLSHTARKALSGSNCSTCDSARQRIDEDISIRECQNTTN